MKIMSKLHILFLLCVINIGIVSAAEDDLERLKEVKQALSVTDKEDYSIKELKRLRRSDDDRVRVEATVLLAAILRKNHYTAESEELLVKYSGFESQLLVGPNLLGVMEWARSLATSGKFRLAIKHLDFAKQGTSNWLPTMRILATYGDVSSIALEYEAAEEQYAIALKHGRESFLDAAREYSNKREMPEWNEYQELSKEVTDKRTVAKENRERVQYGDSWVEYRNSRLLHMKGAYLDAIAAYANLEKSAPKSVYAEAAQLYRIQCLFTLADYKIALDELRKFIRKDPYGLYRGEAMLEMARYQIFVENDIGSGAKSLRDALEWTSTARRSNADVDLYVVPPQAKVASAAPPVGMSFNGITIVEEALKPGAVVNRITAEWYIDELESKVRMLLLLELISNEKLGEGRENLQIAYVKSQAMNTAEKSTYANIKRRFEIILQNGWISTPPDQLKYFTGKARELLLIADYLLMTEKYDQAAEKYLALAKSSLSTHEMRGICYLGYANSLYYRDISKSNHDAAYEAYVKVYSDYASSIAASAAALRLGMFTDQSDVKRIKFLERAYKDNPGSSNGERALIELAHMYWCRGKKIELNVTVKLFRERYPASEWLPVCAQFEEHLPLKKD